MKGLLRDVLTDPITVALTCVCVLLGAIFGVLIFAKVVMAVVGGVQ